MPAGTVVSEARPRSPRARPFSTLAAGAVAALLALGAAGCGDADPSVEPVAFRPAVLDDGWAVSSPEEQGLDPARLEDAYRAALRVDNLHSLLVARHGVLVGEGYFSRTNAGTASPTASVTKSVTSALVGIALSEGALGSLDQPMLDFFPEVGRSGLDPRKEAVTLRQLLQMRSGYPWEERAGRLGLLFSRSNWIPLVAEFPLDHDPGTTFGYSNLTAHLLGIAVTRATGSSLQDYAVARLFGPMQATVPTWPRDGLGYCWGSGDAYLTPRSLAKLGQLYLDDGVWHGARILPAGWVAESWQPYSTDVYGTEIMTSVRELDYGYLWWSARCGPHHVDYAWGHGGQVVFVARDIDVVVVATARYLGADFGDSAWRQERGVLELVGQLVASL